MRLFLARSCKLRLLSNRPSQFTNPLHVQQVVQSFLKVGRMPVKPTVKKLQRELDGKEFVDEGVRWLVDAIEMKGADGR